MELMAPADAVLWVHVAVIAFNLFGLVAVPIGALRGWRFVRIAWWRIAHVALLAAVAAQALLGRACILTVWQAALSGAAGPHAARRRPVANLAPRPAAGHTSRDRRRRVSRC